MPIRGPRGAWFGTAPTIEDEGAVRISVIGRGAIAVFRVTLGPGEGTLRVVFGNRGNRGATDE